MRGRDLSAAVSALQFVRSIYGADKVRSDSLRSVTRFGKIKRRKHGGYVLGDGRPILRECNLLNLLRFVFTVKSDRAGFFQGTGSPPPPLPRRDLLRSDKNKASSVRRANTRAPFVARARLLARPQSTNESVRHVGKTRTPL